MCYTVSDKIKVYQLFWKVKRKILSNCQKNFLLGEKMRLVKLTAAASLAALVLTSGAFAAKKDKASGKKDVSQFVYNKYASPSNSPKMEEWGTLNCHDPKIWQDDDGTYYVYSTDASIGGAGRKGLQIRTSTDLVNWTCLPNTAIPSKNWDKDWLKWTESDRAGAISWAPTIKKQNGLYYLIHGIITDKNNSGDPRASITMAVSTSATGPFYPVAQAAKNSPEIKAKFAELGISYKQSTVVRYTYYDLSFSEMENEDLVKYEMYNTGSYDTQQMEDYGQQNMASGFGAIDPEFIMDVATGDYMVYDIAGTKCFGLTYGSWKGGIALMYLDCLSLKPVDMDGNVLDAPADSVPPKIVYDDEYNVVEAKAGAFGKCIAGGYGAAYEGAQVIYNSQTGYYYCFVSMGSLDWDYRVGVGRSKNVEGPYYDGSGKSMLISPISSEGEYHTIGSKIIGSEELEGEYSFRSQGGESILRTQDGKIVMAVHARTNFLPGYFFFLQIHQMFFNNEGWPVINGNEYYSDSNFTEKLEALSLEDVCGTYDTILTERSEDRGEAKFSGAQKPIQNVYLTDALPTKSKELALNADGSVGGAYTGSWKLASDGYTLSVSLDGIGTFNGYALKAVDWAKKKSGARKVISFTALDGENSGEYLWGNKKSL